MSILIIGEKPSVSRAISAVVGASSTKKGYTMQLVNTDVWQRDS